MKRIHDFVGRELTWTQPAVLKRHFELRMGDEVVATLEFRSPFGSFATAVTADGSWTFKRVGFWQTRVTICPAESDREIATFRNATWTAGGWLELADGRKLKANTNAWMTGYEFKNEAGDPLIRYTRIGGVHLSCKVNIERSAAGLTELPWMVALGWYLAVKMQDDGAAGAVSAAAGG